MKPWIIAHRGANDEAPENSGAAFDRALRYPIDGMEFDVQMTADKELVLHHDRTLFKFAGSLKKVSGLTLEELSALARTGSRFPEFAEEPLITLGETLSRYASRTRLMIEIKIFDRDRRFGRWSEITTRVLEELGNPELKNFGDNIFILSFDPDVLKLAFRIAPQYKYALNLSDKPDGPTGHRSIIDAPPSETDHLFALCAAFGNLSEPLIDFAREKNKLTMTYVCNTPGRVRHAKKFGVDAIMTDRPGWLAEAAANEVQLLLISRIFTEPVVDVAVRRPETGKNPEGGFGTP